MGVTLAERVVAVGRRVDGKPWQLRVVEISGTMPGPATAIVSGILGDKPMGPMAAHGVIERLSASEELAGTITVIPAANLPALTDASRVGPDHLILNRRFPGKATGFITDQFAMALYTELTNAADCVIDLHSGTPEMALWYTYDYGDRELSASFGYLPVVLDHQLPGQLCTAVAETGCSAILPEFGGGRLGNPTVGIEGTLNVLRHRGHLATERTGPATVPLVRDKELFLASSAGLLVLDPQATAVGKAIGAGSVGKIIDAATGETIERFAADRDGGLLLLASVSPRVIKPGDYVAMIGYPEGEVRTG